MADALKVELITRDFNRMLEELANIDAKVEFRDVVKSEAASVMEGALRRTKAAEVSRIRETFAKKEWATFGGKKYFIAKWELPSSTWRAISARRREQLQTKLGARGLSKQSWFHVAGSIGRRIAVPGFVMNANYRGQQYPIDGDSNEDGGGAAYTLTVFNTSPIVQGAGGFAALLSAMGGRASYFRRNMENRAFATIESRARTYPGIFTSQVPSPV